MATNILFDSGWTGTGQARGRQVVEVHTKTGRKVRTIAEHDFYAHQSSIKTDLWTEAGWERVHTALVGEVAAAHATTRVGERFEDLVDTVRAVAFSILEMGAAQPLPRR